MNDLLIRHTGGLRGDMSVTIIRPNETDPILGGTPQPQSLGKLLLRFILLLAVAIAVLAIAWSR